MSEAQLLEARFGTSLGISGHQYEYTSPGKDSVARHDFQEVWINCQSAKHAYVYVSFLLCNNRDSINLKV